MHEDVNEDILARIYIFGCLTNTSVKMVSTEKSRTIRTVRRMPIPAKIAFAGENT
jgi:hypothetical protein